MAPSIARRGQNAIEKLKTEPRVGLIILITAVSFVILGVILALILKWYKRRFYQSLSQQGSPNSNPNPRSDNDTRSKTAVAEANGSSSWGRRDEEMERQVVAARSLATRPSSDTQRYSGGYLEEWDDDFSSQRGSLLSDMKELEANIQTGGRASLELHPVFKQTSEPKASQLSQQWTPPSPLEAETPRPLVARPKVASLPRAATAPVLAASRTELPSNSRQVHPSQRNKAANPQRPPSRRHHLSESHVAPLPRRGTFDAVPEEYYHHHSSRSENIATEQSWI